jgi:hypothetical protein
LTLVELVLVLALLVVIGAITVPLMQGMFSRVALDGAGDLLRGAWAKARLSAMQSGQTHAFRYEPLGRRFQIIALNSLGDPAKNELYPEIEEADPEPAEFVRLSQNRLPEGIVFHSGNVASSAQTMATIPMALESTWSQPILFFPDGTTSDATLLLSNSQEAAIRVTLRGLTGISQSVEAEIEASP